VWAKAVARPCLNKNKIKTKRAGGCKTSGRATAKHAKPWVQSPALEGKKRKEKKRELTRVLIHTYERERERERE
jgi:hypothetical protein